MYLPKGEITVYSEDLVINGGVLTAVNDPADQSGNTAVFAEDSITVNGGEVNVTAKGKQCHGMHSVGDFTVVSGKVTINSKGSGDELRHQRCFRKSMNLFCETDSFSF